MNLLELIVKHDPNVLVQSWDAMARMWKPHVAPRSLFSKSITSHVKFDGWYPRLARDTIRGLLLRSGTRVVVKNASHYWPDYARGEGVVKFCSNGDNSARVLVGWSHDENGDLDHQAERIVNRKLCDFAVPPTTESSPNLLFTVPPQRGVKLFLGVHRLLDRNQLYALCKGEGVEIGPGPKPQILPRSNTHVRYIEQATPEQWQQLYGKDTAVPIDPKLWKHYVVGNADDIPALPGSLDFIFSSHVVEHLANPLGHFSYWATLLKAGGVVAAVIPDRSGCKDYVFSSSTLDELMTEYREASMKPTRYHYERWAKHRAPDADPEQLLGSGRSIHVHFYTPRSMVEILEEMHERLGFSKFSVIREHNHKDFFIVLTK